MEKVLWANSNSNGRVEVFYNNSNGRSIVLEFAFEDVDDALIFKIQYSK